MITSSQEHPKKTRSGKLSVHSSQYVAAQSKQQVVSDQTPVTTSAKKQDVNKLITSKEQILSHYPDVFEGIRKCPHPPYNIQLDPSIPPKPMPCCPIPIHFKESFKQEIDKKLQVGVLKPVNEAMPWINSFVLVEDKDKTGNLKL